MWQQGNFFQKQFVFIYAEYIISKTIMIVFAISDQQIQLIIKNSVQKNEQYSTRRFLISRV